MGTKIGSFGAKCLTAALISAFAVCAPIAGSAKGGGSSGSSHGGGSTTLRGSTAGRLAPGVGRVRAANGAFRNVRTADGSPLVIRQGGKTTINGKAWQASPVRQLAPTAFVKVQGRPAPFWRQPTRIVAGGRAYVLADGPRLLPPPRYYRSSAEAARGDAFLWGFLSGYSSPSPLVWWSFGYWSHPSFLGGYVIGMAMRPTRASADVGGGWSGAETPWPAPTPEPDTVVAKRGSANAVETCTYSDRAGESATVPVRVRSGDGCPAPEYPSPDMDFPEPTAFCQYSARKEDDTPRDDDVVLVPVARTACPLASPPTPTPATVVQDEDDGDAESP